MYWVCIGYVTHIMYWKQYCKICNKSFFDLILITYDNFLCASSGGLGEVDEGGRSCQRRVAASRQGLTGDEETAGEYEEGHPSGNTSCCP